MHDRRFDPRHAHRLLGREREEQWQPRRFLRDIGITAGHTVADLGCGPGFWTLPLADVVTERGNVWALDVSPEMLRILREQQPPAHVRPVISAFPAIPLPHHSVDWAWAAFIFHEVLPHPVFAAAMRRVVRPGGTAAVLEWRPDAASTHGPPRDHRLWPEQVIEWLEAAGFESVRVGWRNEDTYLILAT